MGDTPFARPLGDTQSTVRVVSFNLPVQYRPALPLAWLVLARHCVVHTLLIHV